MSHYGESEFSRGLYLGWGVYSAPARMAVYRGHEEMTFVHNESQGGRVHN